MWWKKICHIFKNASKLERCSKLPSSTVPYVRYNFLQQMQYQLPGENSDKEILPRDKKWTRNIGRIRCWSSGWNYSKSSLPAQQCSDMAKYCKRSVPVRVLFEAVLSRREEREPGGPGGQYTFLLPESNVSIKLTVRYRADENLADPYL